MANKVIVFNVAKYFSSGIFQNYLVFIPDKNAWNILVAEAELNCKNLISEENIENITKSDSNFAPNYVDHHLLPDMNFNGHCLIKINISISKK